MSIQHPLAHAIGALLSLACLQAAAQSLPAADAGATTTLDTVTVTGSHIKRAQIEGVGPVAVIDAEAIQRSGATSVDVLLQRLPASAGFAGNQTNAYWTSNGYGTSQVNLRGLGINRTLVLLNGRRVVNGGTGANSSVDLNAIPVALIERIEVLKDGASAIYGADAVAGVVNIITRRDVEGLELGVRYGQTTHGDGEDTAYDLIWGWQGERGSLTTLLSHAESKAVPMASRAACGLGEVDGALQCVGSSATIGGRALLADGTMVNFNQTPGGDGDFYERYAAKHNFNSNAMLNAVNPIRRTSAGVFGDVALGEDLRLFTELLYTQRRSNQMATPGSIGQYRPVVLEADHPTNPTGQRLTLQRRRLAEAGPRDFYQETDTSRAVLGLEGRFGIGWEWSTALNWGRTEGVDGSTNVADLLKVARTLDTTQCSSTPGAAIPCADYLGYGDVSREVLDYILFTSRDTGGNEQRAFTANLNGPLFELPAGWVGFATGVEIRRDRGWRHPDPLIQAGIANSNAQDSVEGEYTAREAFVELAVPLLQDQTWARDLVFNLAVRHSDYDLFGADTTYKLGLDWQVTPGFKLRANRSTAFRVPNVPELFGGLSEGNLVTADPCSGWSARAATDAVYRSCQAAGVPAGYVQLGNTVLTTTGGNIALQPEDARTLTIGAVWTPAFAGGLTVTVDYWDIRIDNAIQSVAGGTKLALCHATPELSHPFCGASHVTRNPLTGEIDFLSSQPVNAASERASGVDLGLLHAFALGDWQLALDWDVSWLRRYDLVPYPGGPTIAYAGLTTGGRGSYPEWRSLASLSATRGAWSGAWTVQYIGAVDDINAAPGDIGAHASAVTYHNLVIGHAVSEALSLSLGVDNLFDRRAPFVQSYTDANTDTMTYDLLGRRMYAKLSYRW
ncbi:TonB-dependent receptor [Xanthomonas sp. XNM01]|uniref:TonB-dependent receptor n=1 Tax=Xanthomonas sp. XNM01 TaxID=2769289 RepID=UPI00177AED73|nr:TonB-dependent receptor [Xanthomonas sp. XNM01]MBD9370753.1 TonB-dependent receptor [Xanthomonas sp. XNM01]